MAQSDPTSPPAEDAPGGKGRPTPRRRDREAEHKRPLVSNSRKEARAKMAKQRERVREGMANGEERYLPQRDKGPQRRWARDYIDARWNVGEILIPVMFAVIIATFLPSLEAQFIAIVILWGFFLVTIIDSAIAAHLVRKALREKYGAENVQPGVRWYSAMRALQMRGLRLPKPQVRRGQKPQ